MNVGHSRLDKDEEEQQKDQKGVRTVVSIKRACSCPNSMTSVQLGLKSDGNFLSCRSGAAGCHKKETVKIPGSRCV